MTFRRKTVIVIGLNVDYDMGTVCVENRRLANRRFQQNGRHFIFSIILAVRKVIDIPSNITALQHKFIDRTCVEITNAIYCLIAASRLIRSLFSV